MICFCPSFLSPAHLSVFLQALLILCLKYLSSKQILQGFLKGHRGEETFCSTCMSDVLRRKKSVKTMQNGREGALEEAKGVCDCKVDNIKFKKRENTGGGSPGSNKQTTPTRGVGVMQGHKKKGNEGERGCNCLYFKTGALDLITGAVCSRSSFNFFADRKKTLQMLIARIKDHHIM